MTSGVIAVPLAALISGGPRRCGHFNRREDDEQWFAKFVEKQCLFLEKSNFTADNICEFNFSVKTEAYCRRELFSCVMFYLVIACCGYASLFVDDVVVVVGKVPLS